MKSGSNSKLVIGVDATPLCRDIDGVGRYTHNLIKELAGTHKDISIVLVGFLGDKLQKEIISSLPQNVAFHKIPFFRKLYQILFAKLFLACNISFLLPDFDFFIYPNFTMFPYVKRSGLMRYVFIHDTAYIDMPDVVQPRNKRFLSHRVPWSIKRADKVLCVSEFTANRVRANYPFANQKIVAIGTGIDALFFKHRQQKPKLPGRIVPKSYILCVGTLEPRKNLEVLIRAHSMLPLRLRRENPLLLVGKLRQDAKTLAQLIENTDYVYAFGYVNDADLPAIYKNARLFVIPSRYEGFGIPLIEAMASRVPVLASDIPVFRTIARDGVTYVDTRTSRKLSDSLANALGGKPSKKRVDKAYTVAQEHAWNKVSNRFWKIIKEK